MSSPTEAPKTATFHDIPLNGVRVKPNLMGIRYVEGGETAAATTAEPAAASAVASQGQQAATQAAQAGHQAQASQAAATAATTAADQAQAGVKFEDLDERTQAHVKSLRAEAKTANDAAKAAKDAQDATAKQMKQITDLLGITQGDATPDPEKLTAQLAEVQKRADSQSRENAVLLSAATAGANPAALLDSRSFVTQLDGVNPGDTAAVTALIQDWVQKNPSYKVGTAGASSATGGAGAGGSTEKPRATSIFDALKALPKS